MKKKQLILLHFAGGNAYSLRFIKPYLEDFDLIFPELPGRGLRMREPLLANFEAAAADILKQITSRLNGAPFGIYGHSLGATLALRVAGMLEQAQRPAAFLVVSGNAGPGIMENKRYYQMPQDEFVEELKKLGGFPEELLANAELLDFFVPILRADFEMTEANEPIEQQPVHAPITAVMGRDEEHAAAIDNWRNYTKSAFECELMEGGHFFIQQHPLQLTGLIRKAYDNALLLRQQPAG